MKTFINCIYECQENMTANILACSKPEIELFLMLNVKVVQ